MAKSTQLVDLDLNQNQLLNAVAQNLAVAPSTVGLKAGYFYYNTTAKTTYQWNGTAWIDMGNNYVHPTYTAQNPTLSGALVLSTLVTDGTGHVTGATTRTLTPANIGAEPTVTPGTTAQYYKGDKTWAALNTAAVPESGNLYFTAARAIASALAGFALGANSTVLATDTILQAMGKLQAQVNAKEPTITGAATTTYWRGDKTFQTLNTSVVTEGTNLYYTDARVQTKLNAVNDFIRNGTAAQDAQMNIKGGEAREFFIIPKINPVSPTAAKHYLFSSDDYGEGGEPGGGTPVLASINEIGDVTILNPATGQALVWNGSKWANQAVTGVNDATTNATQTWSSAKISTELNAINSTITGGLVNKGGYDAATNTPLLDATPIVGIKNGWTYVITAAGTFFTEAVQVGDMIVASQDNPTTLAHWTIINKNIPDIVYATETTAGIVEIANQAEVTAGTDHTKIVTALTLQNNIATATNRGVTTLATAAEVQAGTEATKAVTSQTLHARTATEARTGLVELATIAEVQAGTDTTRAVTAAGLQANLATTTNRGILTLATQAEVDAGVEATKAVTSATLKATMDSRVGGYSIMFGNAVLQSFNITHNLGTVAVTVEIIEVATGETVFMQVRRSSTTVVNIQCNNVPATNQYMVIIKK